MAKKRVMGNFIGKMEYKILKFYGAQIQEVDFLYLTYLKKNNKIKLKKEMAGFIQAMSI